METGPQNQSSSDKPGSGPPALPDSEPPVIASFSGSTDVAPPPLPAQATKQAVAGRRFLAVVLSLGLMMFLADAVLSLTDDSLILIFGVHFLTGLSGAVFLFATLLAILIYALMGVTPAIPKRIFLPVTLYNVVAGLALLPVMIYGYGRMLQMAWFGSLCQLLLALLIIYRVQRGSKSRWPLVPLERLKCRGFSGLNLLLFLSVNVLVLLPATLAYLAACTSLAVSHFSEGFVALRPGGVSVQVRTYARNDGKTIQLVPMAHIGDRDFYRKLVQSFPTNAIILMEGVTDNQNLLTNHITYGRMATSLHLSEQQKEFTPPRNQTVRADIDVDQFSTNTIGFLNLAMLIHSRGLTAENLLQLLQYSPPPEFERQLLEDLLRKRNRRVLEELRTQLADSDCLIVPWGAAHMPQISQEIQNEGFRAVEVRDVRVIQFGAWSPGKRVADQ